MRFRCCFISIIIFQSFGFSQNLLPDPGFELKDHCPDNGFMNRSSLEATVHWINPNKATSDYMNKCAKGVDGVMNNLGGSQEPYEGDGYVGICYGRKIKYREYVETRLTEPLIKDSVYLIKMFVSLGDKVFFAINEMGVALTKDKLRSSDKGEDNLGISSYIPVRNGAFFTNQKGWTEVSALYKALGGEKFITIGFFNPFPDLQLVGNKKPVGMDGEWDDTYYFIDAVSLEQISSPRGLKFGPPNFSKYSFPDPKGNDAKKSSGEDRLPDGLFETNKSLLIPGSFEVLDAILEFMNADSSRNISIDVHCHTAGSPSKNMQLSQNRALMLQNYLVSRGIWPTRLTVNPIGDLKPQCVPPELECLFSSTRVIVHWKN
jgi:OmpA-OmpF porin, OOP family